MELAIVNCSHLNKENRNTTFKKILKVIARDIGILIVDKYDSQGL